MSLQSTFEAANDATFQGRCLAAAWKAAANILNESEQTPNHAARVEWALNILRDRQSITPRVLAMQVLRNATIAANPAAATDGDIEFAVASYLSDLILIR